MENGFNNEMNQDLNKTENLAANANSMNQDLNKTVRLDENANQANQAMHAMHAMPVKNESNFEKKKPRPLKLAGVFGISWDIFRRGFFRTVFFMIIVLGIAVFVNTYVQSNINPQQIFDDMMERMPDNIYGMSNTPAEIKLYASTSLDSLSGLISPLLTFLLIPMGMGAIYLELDDRMHGRKVTLGGLFKKCGTSLRHLYTTYLASYVTILGIGFALVFIMFIVLFFAAMTFMFPIMLAAADKNAGTISMLIFMFAIMVLIGNVAITFTAFIFPIAAHESKENPKMKGFNAVGKSFKIACAKFFRAYFVRLLVLAIICIVEVAVILIMNTFFVKEAVIAAYTIINLIGMLYLASVDTVLYFDLNARSEIKDEQKRRKYEEKMGLNQHMAPNMNMTVNLGNANANGFNNAPVQNEVQNNSNNEDNNFSVEKDITMNASEEIITENNIMEDKENGTEEQE